MSTHEKPEAMVSETEDEKDGEKQIYCTNNVYWRFNDLIESSALPKQIHSTK